MGAVSSALASGRRLESPAGSSWITKVLVPGCMVETALMFPLANIEAPWFRAATLSIFIITELAFMGLHADSFVRFGPFTVPPCLLILLLFVLPAGSPRKELVPWLPLFIATSSLLPVVVHGLSKRYKVQARTRPVDVERGSNYSIDTWSGRSSLPRASHDQPGRPPSQPHDSVLFGCPGRPSSRYSHQTGDSDVGLSDVSGRAQSDWDSQTRGFFPAQSNHRAPQDSGQAHRQEGYQFGHPDLDLVSENASASSGQPLLDSP
ncbi:hypothetical protein QBC47DRAFT_55878 [Echria macrotheca]|uniref:Uncharacterized protein n=1 Tax=Echria macrotheca TaxID=438768 RepID=A0AAJ0B631_9PEZI|nr:hypothetical protein QBC47DRAFT_55878 [Echria macrotheca]